jgi:hypothetical protein
MERNPRIANDQQVLQIEHAPNGRDGDEFITMKRSELTKLGNAVKFRFAGEARGRAKAEKETRGERKRRKKLEEQRDFRRFFTKLKYKNMAAVAKKKKIKLKGKLRTKKGLYQELYDRGVAEEIRGVDHALAPTAVDEEKHKFKPEPEPTFVRVHEPSLQDKFEEFEKNQPDFNELVESDSGGEPTFQQRMERDEPSFDELVESDKDGAGFKKGKGLYDTEINTLMKKHKKYVGTYTLEEMKKIKPPKTSSFGFIINTKKRTDKAVGHWLAIYIDPTGEKTVEFYDPFGTNPPPAIMKGLKHIIEKIDPTHYLKFKVNKYKDQSVSTSNCGHKYCWPHVLVAITDCGLKN